METINSLVCFILIIAMTVLGSFASLFLKKASGSKEIKEMILNKNLYIGGIMYVVAALFNILVLRYMDYSIVLPLTSITYIWTMIISYKILNENISKKKIGGVCLIVIGAIAIVL